MKIRVTSTTNLIAFLKKLKVVDRSVLLELKEDKLLSKVHTPDKSVMKYALGQRKTSSWNLIFKMLMGKRLPPN